MCILGGHDPMSEHERTFIYRYKWCGRRMLKQNRVNVFIQVIIVL